MSMQSAALSHFPLSQRDYALQPKVSLPRQRLVYLGFCAPVRNNPNGVAPKGPMMGATPSALKMLFEHCSQGGSCLPTLGFGAESRWDSNATVSRTYGQNSTLRRGTVLADGRSAFLVPVGEEVRVGFRPKNTKLFI
jgi:hypothetical protein